MLLYEQRLYQVMCDLIPESFANSDRPAMQHAADTWRLPYWDWAMKKPEWDTDNPDSPKNSGPNATNVKLNVPFILTQKNVEVMTATGSTSVPNPMLKFVLPNNKKHPEYKTFGSYKISEPVCNIGLIESHQIEADLTSSSTIAKLPTGIQAQPTTTTPDMSLRGSTVRK